MGNQMRSHPLIAALVIAFCFTCGFSAQAYTTAETLAWVIPLGGSDEDWVTAVEPFPDGSFAVVGEAKAPFYVSDPEEDYPAGAFVAKFNGHHQPAWVRTVSPASVSRNAVNAMDALPDGSLFVTMQYFGEVTLGEGEPNEITFPPPPPLAGGTLIAAFAPDGILKWASAAVPAQAGEYIQQSSISASTDGTCYVSYQGFTNATFAAGTPEAITTEGANNNFLVCYNNKGSLRWVKQTESLAFQVVVAFDNCCVVLHDSPRVITTYSSSGSVLWERSSYNYLFAERIPGSMSFIAYGGDEFARFDVWESGAFIRLWNKPNPTAPQHGGSILRLGAWPDGHGVIQTDSFQDCGFFLFWPDGTVLETMELGLNTLTHCAAPSWRFPEYYTAGMISQETFGEGQPGETTLTATGTGWDGYVALYGREAGYWIDTRTVGRGQISLDPFLPVYPPGTAVTATAEPTFYDHDRFVEWQGEYCPGCKNKQISFSVTRDIELTAVFEEFPGAPPLPAASVAALATLAAMIAVIKLRRD